MMRKVARYGSLSCSGQRSTKVEARGSLQKNPGPMYKAFTQQHSPGTAEHLVCASKAFRGLLDRCSPTAPHWTQRAEVALSNFPPDVNF